MSNFLYLILVIVAMMAVTFGIRALPFIFGDKLLREQRWIRSLGDFLPLSIMVLLVLSGIFDTISRGTVGAAVAAIAVVVALQWCFSRALLSIFAGALLYIALVNGWVSAIF